MSIRRTWGVVSLLVLMAISPVWAVDTDQAVVDLVRQEYDLQPPEYEIEIVGNQLRTRMVDPEDLSFRPLSLKEPLGLFTIRVEIVHQGESVDQGQVRLRISRFAEVLVSKDRIGRHEDLNPNNFEKVRSDITNLREQPITSVEQLTRQRSTRNISRGTILTTGAMERVPDIRLGGEVVIAYTDVWGSITAPGRALEAGWIGARMKVKNLATGKVVEAELQPDGTVEVNP